MKKRKIRPSPWQWEALVKATAEAFLQYKEQQKDLLKQEDVQASILIVCLKTE
ncbi:MAG: hypothetical protein J5906_02220 [Acidaminococcaceae bacterium]|nr:hypothetical protein [Acidaminococcaceae bacterium]